MAREMVSKSPDMPEKILEQIPSEKQKEITRRMTARRKPVRLVQLTMVQIRMHMISSASSMCIIIIVSIPFMASSTIIYSGSCICILLTCRKAPQPPSSRPIMRKSSVLLPGTTPKTFVNVVRWFKESEAPRGVGKEKDGSISVWFHGKD